MYFIIKLQLLNINFKTSEYVMRIVGDKCTFVCGKIFNEYLFVKFVSLIVNVLYDL